MYTMKVLGRDCSSQETWDDWLEKGKQALKAAKIPRMLITGDSDGTFSVDDVTQVKNILEVPDECFHVVQDAGHIPMLEKPEEVSQTIRTFLCNKTTCLMCISKTTLSSSTEVDPKKPAASDEMFEAGDKKVSVINRLQSHDQYVCIYYNKRIIIMLICGLIMYD